LTVQASGTGVSTVSQTFTLIVSAATPASSFGFTLGNSTLSITAGATASTAVTLTRTNFTGGVNFTVDNLPSGVTASFAPNPAPATTSTLTFTATTSAPPTTATVLVRGTSAGLTDVAVPLALTVAAAPTFSLAATPATLSVVQGGTGSAQLTAARTGGFAGTIAYTSAVTPTGLTSALTGTAGDTPTLTITPAATLAPGNYTITVTGMSGTITQQTAVTVTVTAAPTIRLDFSNCSATSKPVWVAVQNGTGTFTQVTGTGDVYAVPALTAGRGAIAIVTVNQGLYYTTAVHYLSQAELAAYNPGCATTVAGKSISGSVAGVSGTQFGYVSLGGANASTNAGTPAFQLSNVMSGVQDLVAYRAAGFAATAGDRIVIHRDLNLATGGTTGVIDFGAAEAVAPATANLTVTGGAVNSYFETLNYLSGASCSSSQLNFSTNGVPSPITLYGVPASLQRPTDFHQVVLQQFSGQSDFRSVMTSFHTLADRSVAIGAGLGPLTVTTLAGPYKRYQAVFTLASDYVMASLGYSGPSTGASYGSVLVDQSAGYLAGNTAITLALPDFSAVAGFQLIWVPATSTVQQYSVSATSTPPATFCSEGATLRTASSGTGAT
jgi:hypothetical protein